MPTPAVTQIMSALEAALAGAYTSPAIKVLVKARPASEPGKAVQPGWTPGNPLPCFVISEIDPEPIDTLGTFELLSREYPIAIEYAKAAPPKNWIDDVDVRAKREELIQLLYRPDLAGLPAGICAMWMQALPVYTESEAHNVVISGLLLKYTVHSPRPGRG